MTIAIASDHAGYDLKEFIKKQLDERGIAYQDYGTDNAEDSVDYSDFGQPASASVADGSNERGILICGTGLGMSLTANRYKGIRGTLCHNEYTAEMARKHNDSNMLILGARVLSEEEAAAILTIWLDTDFEGGRHKRRIDKLED